MDQQIFHRLLDIFEFKKAYQLKSSGLNHMQLHVIEEIHKQGEIKTLDISRHMDIPPSTLIGVLDELENKNLIKRSRQKEDKRVVMVAATDMGKQKVHQHISEDEVFLRNLTACLNEREAEKLEELLRKIIDNTKEPEELFKE